MVSELEQLMIDKGYYEEKKLADIPDSLCCKKDETLLLDFDLIKKKFCNEIKIQELKSCDTLLFNTEFNELIFFEIKTKSQNIECYEYVRQKMKELPNKMVDSLLILFGIAYQHNMTKDFLHHFLNPKKIKIHAFILCNADEMNYKQIQDATLDLRQETNIEISNIFNKVDILNCSAFAEKYGTKN